MDQEVKSRSRTQESKKSIFKIQYQINIPNELSSAVAPGGDGGGSGGSGGDGIGGGGARGGGGSSAGSRTGNGGGGTLTRHGGQTSGATITMRLINSSPFISFAWPCLVMLYLAYASFSFPPPL
ncbi:protein no-on-transient A-like [Olea europaea var. sylvestris]|uniref:protein no-on-transient A-like n=1 Tax=Olea europaea var. sylvestris TaxID=158386 RepID=UPI000C1D495D|nr:protein no-on-transient A-like [Olea europaea var. sylvestris]